VTLQQRIDYVTSMSETIVAQLSELIALHEQIQKATESLGRKKRRLR
jgi:hypothetical protein